MKLFFPLTPTAKLVRKGHFRFLLQDSLAVLADADLGLLDLCHFTFLHLKE